LKVVALGLTAALVAIPNDHYASSIQPLRTMQDTSIAKDLISVDAMVNIIFENSVFYYRLPFIFTFNLNSVDPFSLDDITLRSATKCNEFGC
jgi:hypothetical protein